MNITNSESPDLAELIGLLVPSQACSSIFTVVVQSLMFALEDCGSAQALLQEHHSHGWGHNYIRQDALCMGSLFRYMTEKYIWLGSTKSSLAPTKAAKVVSSTV